MYMVLLAGLALGASSEATTGATREGLDLAQYLDKRAEVDWTKYRWLSFKDLKDESPESIEGKKKATRMAIASLNKTAEPLDDIIIEANSDWWAINVTKIDWPADAWEDMSKNWVYYTQTPKYLQDRLKAKTGSAFPLMRHDVFVKDCWTAEWYSRFMKLPQDRNTLIKTLKVVKNDNFVVGIIDKNKTVTVHAGKVARFETEDGRAFWIRMNYKDTHGDNDSRKFPENFDCDYNEVAYELPNGLDGYGSYEGKSGKLSHFSDTKISVDDTSEAKDGAGVQLGQSCFSCHRSGARSLSHAAPVADLHLTQTAFNRRAYDIDRLASFAKKDGERWKKALQAINGLTPEENKRHILAIRDKFNKKLNVSQMAKEIGVSTEDLVERMKFSEEKTLRRLARQPDMEVERTEFEDVYPAIAKLFVKDDEQYLREYERYRR